MKCPSIRQSLRASAAAVVIVWVNIMLSALVSANTGLFPHASRGAPLPLPREWHSGQKQWAVAARAFSFAIAPATPPCPILADALARYYALTFPDQLFDQLVHYHASTSKDNIPDDMPVLSQLQVKMDTGCSEDSVPDDHMDESYTLEVGWSRDGASLSAREVWGALRGLETFAQLVHRHPVLGYYQVNATLVRDAPRFPHRGLLVDTARHYVPLGALLQLLDALAANKMNVLHWHIVDDESFPFQSVTFPYLSIAGAYDPNTHIYTHDDVRRVVEYAAFRGIRVMPEWDTPGHSYSWGVYYRELLTQCCDAAGRPDGTVGPMDPTRDSTYAFVAQLLRESSDVFPERLVHLGGDEVFFNCWQSNPNVTAFMAQAGIAGNYSALQSLYVERVVNITAQVLRKTPVLWQEAFEHGARVGTSTAVVQVWTGSFYHVLADVTRAGYRALLSACWYLNNIFTAADWHVFYQCDPQRFEGSAAQKRLVIGGEAAIWGEWVDATNLVSRTFPRGSAVAERLWSDASATNETWMEARLEEHRCRMLSRGLPVQSVNGAGFCAHEWAATASSNSHPHSRRVSNLHLNRGVGRSQQRPDTVAARRDVKSLL